MLMAGGACARTRARDNEMLPSHGESQWTEQPLVGWLHNRNGRPQRPEDTTAHEWTLQFSVAIVFMFFYAGLVNAHSKWHSPSASLLCQEMLGRTWIVWGMTTPPLPTPSTLRLWDQSAAE